ncbi:hypothetical protein SLEP1_g59835 [Rubroshorea leprosula]|uniref:Uncharacterized protein n=1 Tax=Rubroshorea leprosula TaxID=152421 RepID=A0AAV5MWQ8_9ROSI|nr:hypothetical protein SLEP1_g59835 [Rubroshorea leprosula]
MALGKGLTSFPKAPTTRTGEAASEKSSLIPRTGVLYIAMRSREGDHSLVTPNFLMPKPPRADSRLGYAILLSGRKIRTTISGKEDQVQSEPQGSEVTACVFRGKRRAKGFHAEQPGKVPLRFDFPCQLILHWRKEVVTSLKVAKTPGLHYGSDFLLSHLWDLSAALGREIGRTAVGRRTFIILGNGVTAAIESAVAKWSVVLSYRNTLLKFLLLSHRL